VASVNDIAKVAVSLDTWDSWHDAATGMKSGRRKLGAFVALASVLAIAVIGLAFTSGSARWSVLVYSPVAALVTVPIAVRGYGERRFSIYAQAMRSTIVPVLVTDIPDAMLLHLAQFGGGTVASEMKVLRARRESRQMTIEAEHEEHPGPTYIGWSSPSP
jgi:hypothetical protein